ncbi:conserved hypothetical protein [Talaromyces stipitatus ATCC 10500]|uniref:DUF1770 domain protein n=1 Tax=Talaromyces stipitatus (strain ATCC 10500 / CBS 375.48 / QM 6759 / NRRL 1006) TaxID=441959 RepID=B8MRC0_TALSN|nr:uncharacterized protein TSTA_055200 [Talaromyces stipitatus ATCC 10500]EED13015.1 conserved hypothetical protein [Talaromyces stipitatus ATCC 10500]
MSHAALGIAETIQTASIKRHPSPRHDINPSTAASEKLPYEDADHSDTASIATDILDRPAALRPAARRRDLPPLPDLRFEQSYLASIRGAETWQRVTWITIRDQVFLPLIQGTLWTLALCGWRFWNRNAQLHGNTLGTRLRRWWYGVNNWPIPPQGIKSNKKFAERVQDFYTAQFSSD